MDLKSLIISIILILPSIIIGSILGYLYDDPNHNEEYDVFEDYYGRKE